MTRKRLSHFELDSSLNQSGWAYTCSHRPVIP